MANYSKRIHEIFKLTEKKWLENAKQVKKINYLLIAESAPWSNFDDEINYFYSNLHGNWCQRILSTFDLNPESGVDHNLHSLAEKGFLMIDTLPIAFTYSESSLRNGVFYELLVNSFGDYWMEKLSNINSTWNNDLKVAFAFQVNGKAVMKMLNYKLLLTGKVNVKLSERMIASDGSGYTNPTKLRRIFNL